MSRPRSGPHIVTGLPEGLEAAAARLYWAAFGAKLGRLMGPEARALGFLTATISHDRMLAALDGAGGLLGIAAYKIAGRGFSAGGLRDFWRHYGAGTLWRAPPLLLLERKAPPGVLQMDGICVAPGARGQGVGTGLLEALFGFAAEQGLKRITLDVIDSNPRARALYERLGFQPVETTHLGPLRHLFGFAASTRMERELQAAPAPG